MPHGPHCAPWGIMRDPWSSIWVPRVPWGRNCHAPPTTHPQGDPSARCAGWAWNPKGPQVTPICSQCNLPLDAPSREPRGPKGPLGPPASPNPLICAQHKFERLPKISIWAFCGFKMDEQKVGIHGLGPPRRDLGRNSAQDPGLPVPNGGMATYLVAKKCDLGSLGFRGIASTSCRWQAGGGRTVAPSLIPLASTQHVFENRGIST